MSTVCTVVTYITILGESNYQIVCACVYVAGGGGVGGGGGQLNGCYTTVKTLDLVKNAYY